jgi:hypothetical protein
MITGPEFFTISKYILFLVQDNRNFYFFSVNSWKKEGEEITV